jgi:peptide/nickel transport system substrate-binding protein/oligopeptide transport system substrate-binding protein
MVDESLNQRKRNALVAGGLFLITLIASTASILPFVGVTSIGQLGTAIANVATAYSRGLVRLTSYVGIIGFSLFVALWAIYLVRVLLLARRKTDRRWRLYEAALALPLIVGLLAPLYVPKPVAPPPIPLSDEQQLWRQGMDESILDTHYGDQLDPAHVVFTSASLIAQLVFPGLVKLDARSKPQNWVASRLQITPDGATYTFTLRSGLHWSDGTAIDATDFAYSINRALDPCTKAGPATYLYAIKDASVFNGQPCDNGTIVGPHQTLIGDSLVVTDPQTLIIKLAKPTPTFLAQLTYPVSYAVPRALIEAYGARWTAHLTDKGGFGGDLYTMGAFDPARGIILRRNQEFWGAKPKLRELDFTIFRTEFTLGSEQEFAAYLDGQTEVARIASAQFSAARLRPDFLLAPTLGIQYLAPNWSIPPFDDLRMRQAFALALDKQRLTQDTAPQWLATNHIVPAGMPGYNESLKGPDGSASLSGNVPHARALAQDFANEKCAGDLARCPKVTLTFPDDAPGLSAQLQEAIGMWNAALPGLPIELKPLPPDQYETTRSSKTAQLIISVWAADYADPEDFLAKLCAPDASFNVGNADELTATTLMRQAESDLNPSHRLATFNQAEQLLVSNVAIIPLNQFQSAYLVRPYVTNFQVSGETDAPSVETWQRMYLAKQ